MTEKVRKVSVLLQTLSRIPGLGFLADTDRQLREAADSADNVTDGIEDMKRYADDVQNAAHDVVSSDDEE